MTHAEPPIASHNTGQLAPLFQRAVELYTHSTFDSALPFPMRSEYVDAFRKTAALFDVSQSAIVGFLNGHIKSGVFFEANTAYRILSLQCQGALAPCLEAIFEVRILEQLTEANLLDLWDRIGSCPASVLRQSKCIRDTYCYHRFSTPLLNPIEALQTAIDSYGSDVLERAIPAIVRWDDGTVIMQIMAQLPLDFSLSLTASMMLVILGKNEHIAALVEASQSPNPEIALFAAMRLVDLASPHAVAAVQRWLNSDIPDVLGHALYACARLGSGAVLRSLLDAIRVSLSGPAFDPMKAIEQFIAAEETTGTPPGFPYLDSDFPVHDTLAARLDHLERDLPEFAPHGRYHMGDVVTLHTLLETIVHPSPGTAACAFRNCWSLMGRHDGLDSARDPIHNIARIALAKARSADRNVNADHVWRT